MIITLTANPSIDRTETLDAPLTRGGVHRVGSVTVQAAGKGVNVARVIHEAGVPVLALLPAMPGDPMLQALDQVGLAYRTVAMNGRVRTNLTLTEPDGTTTKINEPGPELDGETVAALAGLVEQNSAGADWAVLSGSLPPGVPADWYADLVVRLHALGCKVAVDTSDAPLLALVDRFPEAAPDLLKPNSDELAQLTGADAAQLEDAARAGDFSAAVAAAANLVERGVGAVLGTLGASGAVLVTAEGAWVATPPPITPRSTVGAGDSSVAGYVLAETAGQSAPDRLRNAVAYGSAAASLAGSTLPRPNEVNASDVVVRPVG